MNTRKKFISGWLVLMFLGLTLTGCNDFFEPETDDALTGDKYIQAQTEMYTGFLGIVTKMQAVGDKSIYLTDTRAELLEPTSNSPSDLIAIYNYESNLQGNAYADPAGYYDVVIACNDFISNMLEYKEKYTESIDMDHFNALISSTLLSRIVTPVIYKLIPPKIEVGEQKEQHS